VGTDTAERVRSMRAAGHRLDAIAAAVNLKPWVIERRYRQALQEGAREFVATLRETLASRAAGGSTEARAALRELETRVGAYDGTSAARRAWQWTVTRI